MNVLIVYSRNEQEILDRKSALGSYIHTLSMALKQGLDIHVFINGHLIETLNPFQSEDPLESKGSQLKNVVKGIIPVFIKQKVSEKKLYNSHNDLTVRLKSDTTHYDQIIEFYTLGSNVGVELAQQKNIPLHIVYDSPVIEQEEFFKGTRVGYRKLIETHERQTLEFAKSIIVYSKPVKKFLMEKYNLEQTNFIIHQNVDFSRLDFQEIDDKGGQSVNICFLGSFLKWHRVDLLIEVFEEIAEEFENTHLHLIGMGMEFNKIKEQVESSPFKDRIELPGFLDGDQLAQYKNGMHIGIMPGSNWYGAPNKIFEYGAAGMAVISCESPTINDMFEVNHIEFFKMGNKVELKAALKQYLENPDLMQKKARALQHFIKTKYNKENTVKTYSDMLNV